jgi:hypothetical protein
MFPTLNDCYSLKQCVSNDVCANSCLFLSFLANRSKCYYNFHNIAQHLKLVHSHWNSILMDQQLPHPLNTSSNANSRPLPLNIGYKCPSPQRNPSLDFATIDTCDYFFNSFCKSLERYGRWCHLNFSCWWREMKHPSHSVIGQSNFDIVVAFQWQVAECLFKHERNHFQYLYIIMRNIIVLTDSKIMSWSARETLLA